MKYLVRPAASGYQAVVTNDSETREEILGDYPVAVLARQACEQHDGHLDIRDWEEKNGGWVNTPVIIIPTTAIVPYEQRSVNLTAGRRTLPPDGARALDYNYKILNHYARWNSPGEIAVIAAWIMHTWCDYAGSGTNGGNGKLAFAATPRLMLIGEQNTGKSRKEALIRALVRDPTGRISGVVTAPGVRNVLNLGQTVILDEAHRIFMNGTAKMDLQGIIAGGYVHDGVSLTGYKGKDEQSIFGPIVLAAKPEIITMTNDMLTDLFSRAFMIYTKAWEPTPEDPEIPDLGEDFEQYTEEARRLTAAWAAYQRPPASRKLWAIHSIPEELSTRNREIAQPLFAVADRCYDPEMTRDGGVDLRWAIAMRDSVMQILAGNSDTPAAGDRFDSLGMEDQLEQVRGRLSSQRLT